MPSTVLKKMKKYEKRLKALLWKKKPWTNPNLGDLVTFGDLVAFGDLSTTFGDLAAYSDLATIGYRATLVDLTTSVDPATLGYPSTSSSDLAIPNREEISGYQPKEKVKNYFKT